CLLLGSVCQTDINPYYPVNLLGFRIYRETLSRIFSTLQQIIKQNKLRIKIKIKIKTKTMLQMKKTNQMKQQQQKKINQVNQIIALKKIVMSQMK
ncbi:hypothetical protein ACWTWI_03340, partial [Staphylococcus hominis]